MSPSFTALVLLVDQHNENSQALWHYSNVWHIFGEKYQNLSRLRPIHTTKHWTRVGDLPDWISAMWQPSLGSLGTTAGNEARVNLFKSIKLHKLTTDFDIKCMVLKPYLRFLGFFFLNCIKSTLAYSMGVSRTFHGGITSKEVLYLLDFSKGCRDADTIYSPYKGI